MAKAPEQSGVLHKNLHQMRKFVYLCGGNYI